MWLIMACAAAGAHAQSLEQPLPASAEPPAPEALRVAGEPAPEEPEVVVWLRDGRRIEGWLVERGETGILLRIGGIPTPFPPDAVEKLDVLPPLIDRYRAMRDAIDDLDPEAHLRLGEWLLSRRRYDLAVLELERAVELRPSHPRSAALLTAARAQRDLAARSGAAGRGAELAPALPARRTFIPLTPEQINTIKVFEIDLKDPPPITVPRETMLRVLEENAGSSLVPDEAAAREAILLWPPMKQLELMFRLQARAHYGEVEVRGSPRAMERFRDDVHRAWLLNACASSACHGGAEAGRLVLRREKPNSDATVYTNFLILDRFRLSDGTPLIDYDEPQRSPLLHLGLQRRDSLFPHRVVPNSEGRGDLWRPAFRNSDDRRFIESIEWIKSMYRPRPAYPIDYQPPGPNAAAAARPDGRR